MPERINLRVLGSLNINATAENPVYFKGWNGARWGAISFEESSTPSSLSHVIIRGATKGHDATIYSSAVSGHNTDVTLDFLDIAESEGPVYILGGKGTIRDGRFHNPYTGDEVHIKKASALVQRCVFLGNNAPDTDAIDFDGVVNGVIDSCRIYRFRGSNSDGIDLGEGSSNLLIENNLIYYNSDKGVSVGQGSTATIRNNLIVGCVLGVGIKDAGSTAIIDQNTFADCATGVAVYEKNFGDGGGTAQISNTIISKSSAPPVTVDGFSTLTAAYSLSDTTALPGPGNLLVDPQFVDVAALNFELKATSPAIDAGDPAHAKDDDGTRVDIGARHTHDPSDYPYTIQQTVVVNELLANSGSGSDWIELHNRTQSAIDISGWFLSDDGADLMKYRIPKGTVLAADGYVVFTENDNFGAASVDPNKITAFALGDAGETVYLSSAVNDQLTDYQTKEDFGPSLADETVGVYYKPSVDSYNFVPLAFPTPNAPNSSPKIGPIIISEIMYNPKGSGTGDSEYLELLNISSEPVTLFDTAKGKPWMFSNGIEFEFPANPALTMAAGERLLLVKNKEQFQALFGALVPAGTGILEWSSGSLDNGGESLQLSRPGPVNTLGELQYVRVDRVNYLDQYPWPTPADGHGSSLNKVWEDQYGNDYINWMAATPSPGSANAASAPDTDGDGIPDGYELVNGLNPIDPADALLDADGDGQNNLSEYEAGTNPQNAGECFRVAFTREAAAVKMKFEAMAGKSYQAQYKNSLSDQEWTLLKDIPKQGTSALMEITDPLETTGARYYRIIIPGAPR
jgi:parallel beta-helix repeat protein